jgi:hypothetical protein
MNQGIWPDVVDLIQRATLRISSETALQSKVGVRQAFKRMNLEGSKRGIKKDHPVFDMIVELVENVREAIARSIEVAVMSDTHFRGTS